MKIGVVGGSGKEGRGLAQRWARAGHSVMIGSRDAQRGRECALEMSREGAAVAGGGNAEACAFAEVALLSVPYAAHRETLESLKGALAGKILVDITVPLKPPKVRRVQLPEGRAAALEAQSILGPGVRVVAALHHVSSVHLADPNAAIDCDVLVCSDDDAAKNAVIALVSDLGVRGLDAGVLENAIALESLTPVLLHMNRHYGTSGIGLRFTKIP